MVLIKIYENAFLKYFFFFYKEYSHQDFNSGDLSAVLHMMSAERIQLEQELQEEENNALKEFNDTKVTFNVF